AGPALSGYGLAIHRPPGAVKAAKVGGSEVLAVERREVALSSHRLEVCRVAANRPHGTAGQLMNLLITQSANMLTEDVLHFALGDAPRLGEKAVRAQDEPLRLSRLPRSLEGQANARTAVDRSLLIGDLRQPQRTAALPGQAAADRRVEARHG